MYRPQFVEKGNRWKKFESDVPEDAQIEFTLVPIPIVSISTLYERDTCMGIG